MTTLSATKARQNFFSLMKKSIKTHLPVHITSKTGDAILISQDDYDNLVETLELLSIPGFREGFKQAKEDIRHRRTKSLDDVLKLK